MSVNCLLSKSYKYIPAQTVKHLNKDITHLQCSFDELFSLTLKMTGILWHSNRTATSDNAVQQFVLKV